MIRERRWTSREVAELKVMYEGGVPLREIAERLDRTLSAIKTRAQLHQMCRPRRFSSSQVRFMQAQAIECGLDSNHLPGNPSALKILILLAQRDLLTKQELDSCCSIKDSTRNKSLKNLRGAGLVCIDDFSNPGEVVLKRKAYQSRPEPVLATPEQVRIGALPTMAKLLSAIDVWLPSCCKSLDSIERYKAFIVRQLENAKSGDIPPADFYSIFYCSARR